MRSSGYYSTFKGGLSRPFSSIMRTHSLSIRRTRNPSRLKGKDDRRASPILRGIPVSARSLPPERYFFSSERGWSLLYSTSSLSHQSGYFIGFLFRVLAS